MLVLGVVVVVVVEIKGIEGEIENSFFFHLVLFFKSCRENSIKEKTL